MQQIANDVDEVKRLSYNLISAEYGALHFFSGNQLRDSTHKWLSPPDPSTNHNIACGTHHKKTATWFLEGTTYQEWKSTGSLFWIHGKRLSRPLSKIESSDAILSCCWFWKKRYLVCISTSSCQRQLTSPASSTVIQDIEAMRKAGNASMAYFYFDF